MSSGREPARRLPPWTGVAAVVSLAAVLRVIALATGQDVLRSDESVVGLMAKHVISRGETPLFLYGQPYGGGHAIVAYLAAPLFALFGPSAAILTGVAVAFSLGSVALVWTIVRSEFDKRVAGLAALLYACSPPVFYQSVLVNGGNPSFFLALLSFWFFLRSYRRSGRPLRDGGVAGVCAGAAYYAMDYALVYAIVFVLAALRADDVDRWKRLGVFAGGFLFGCSPLVAFNLANDFEHVRHMTSGGSTAALGGPGVLDALLFACTRGLAAFFSGELDDFEPGATGPGAWLHAGVALVALVVVVVRDRGRLTSRPISPSLLPAAFVVVYLALYAVASFSANRTPRYLLPLCPFLSIVIAQAATTGRAGALRFLGPALVAILVARGTLASLALGTRDWHTEHRVRTSGREIRELARHLERNGVRTVIAPYEIQWRLIFESNESVTAASDLLSGSPRYEPYANEVRERIRAGERFALVTRRDFAFARRTSGSRAEDLAALAEPGNVENFGDELVVHGGLSATDLARLASRETAP